MLDDNDEINHLHAIMPIPNTIHAEVAKEEELQKHGFTNIFKIFYNETSIKDMIL